jgi:lysophospholipase L1-like esterase
MKADVIVISVIALSGLLAAGQAISRSQDSPALVKTSRCAPYVPAAAADREITFAAVGDRVTDWRGARRDVSWVTYADQGPVEWVGGHARSGARIQDLPARVDPVEADVLVILAGTNDVVVAYTNDQIELNLQRIVENSGAENVLLSSIPPVDSARKQTADFNDFLARVAYRHDWSFVDAGSAVRVRTCEFREGLTTDGVRPTPAGARLIGDAIRGVLTTRPTLVADDASVNR